MPLFRRRETLHERMAREGGLDLDPLDEPGRPPGWMETGIHGVPRAREWDVVVTVEAEGVRGEHARFVALADDTLVVEEGENLEPLAVAVEQVATIPYRADATRRSETQWAVGIRQLQVVELADDPGGEEVTLSDHEGAQEVTVDGARSFASLPELEAIGAARGRSYVVHARRLDGALWEVDAAPL